MILLGDAASSLQWAVDNAGSAVWLLALLGRRRRLGREASAQGAGAHGDGRSSGRCRRREPSPPGREAAAAAQSARGGSAAAAAARLHRRRTAVASLDVPVAVQSVSSRVLREAFGDPAHARAAVILAEVLAPPVALR